MCYCKPEIRTPCCGGINCHPKPKELCNSCKDLQLHIENAMTSFENESDYTVSDLDIAIVNGSFVTIKFTV